MTSTFQKWALSHLPSEAGYRCTYSVCSVSGHLLWKVTLSSFSPPQILIDASSAIAKFQKSLYPRFPCVWTGFKQFQRFLVVATTIRALNLILGWAQPTTKYWCVLLHTRQSFECGGGFGLGASPKSHNPHIECLETNSYLQKERITLRKSHGWT